MKADDTGHHLTQKYKDKDTDKDKYNDKDKDKVQIGPNMSYIFEKPRAQGSQIWHSDNHDTEKTKANTKTKTQTKTNAK